MSERDLNPGFSASMSSLSLLCSVRDFCSLNGDVLLLVWQDTMESLGNVAVWKGFMWPGGPLSNLFLSSFHLVILAKIVYDPQFFLLYLYSILYFVNIKKKINVMALSSLSYFESASQWLAKIIFLWFSKILLKSHYMDMFRWFTETKGECQRGCSSWRMWFWPLWESNWEWQP